MTGNKFGRTSKKRLNTCHEKLQRWAWVLNERFNCTVLDGYRGEVRQNEYFRIGTSNVMFPNSDHNVMPSNAVDLIPDPEPGNKFDWDDKDRFKEIAKLGKEIATEMGIKIKWGGNWENFDGPHWYLV